VEGLDGIAIGPFDLSAALGVIGQPGHPTVVEAIGRIVSGAGNLAVGIMCAPEEAPTLAAQGMRLLTIFADVLGLGAAARAAVSAART